jgi:hypothetical protein
VRGESTPQLIVLNDTVGDVSLTIAGHQVFLSSEDGAVITMVEADSPSPRPPEVAPRRIVMAEVVDPGTLPPPIRVLGRGAGKSASAIGPSILWKYRQDLAPDQPIVIQMKSARHIEGSRVKRSVDDRLSDEIAPPIDDYVWRQMEPESRRRLLVAALDCFSERGYHGTTTRDISARAGLSVPCGPMRTGTKRGVNGRGRHTSRRSEPR